MSGDEVDERLHPFRYNPLHDLESLWWVAFHCVSVRVVVQVGDDDQSYRRGDHTCFDTSGVFGMGEGKKSLFKRSTRMLEKSRLLHPAVQEAIKHLDQARGLLVQAYKDAEKDLSKIDFHVADGMHEVLRDCFNTIASAYTNNDVILEDI